MSDNQEGPTSKVEAVMARIRSAVPGGGASASIGVRGTRARPGEANVFSEEVYRSLHQARTIGGGINVTYDVGWRTPIVGQVWMVVRKRIHQEIRIYIDTLTTQQSNLNAHFIRALIGVVESLDGLGLPALRRQQADDAELLAKLRDEVAELRSEVQSLRAALGTSNVATNGKAVGGN